MRSTTSWYVILILLILAPAPPALAQAPGAAVSQDEIALMRKQIAELQKQIQQLQQAQAGAAPAPAAAGAAAAPASATQAQVDKLQKQVDTMQAKQPTAGFNGEHFYLRSADGNFNLMPTGYVIGQYAVYGNQYGAPPNTFGIRAARFGFEGNYGKQLDYVLNIETVSSPTVRDAYMDFKPTNWFKVMAGQMKVPFSMEVGTADTAVDFYNRSIISVLYPDAAGAFRAPGVTIHGDFSRQAIEYWVGAYNGQGIVTNATTNESEIVARLRFSPFRNGDIGLLKGLSFGGSYEFSKAKGLANEMSYSGAMNDNTYTFFPSFHINGDVTRYNFFAAWLDGPFGLRGEYAHLQQDRANIGSLAVGGIGYYSQPPVTGEGYYVSAVYFLTGETEPLNALPRVKHPVLGPASPGESGAPGWGAWAVKFRYSHLAGNAPGSSCDATTTPACPLTPVINPAYSDVTDQFVFGWNWYLNYWVLLKTDFVIDRLKDPSQQGSVGAPGINPRNYNVFFETLQFRF